MFKVVRSEKPVNWTNSDYKDPIVVKQLRKDFYSKCYLCEQINFGNVNVEHFVPHEGKLKRSELHGKTYIILVRIVMASREIEIKSY